MSSESYRSRYGIEKLREHTYQNWSFQCKMLLSEKKVWNIVNGSYPRPREVEVYSDEEQTKFTKATKEKIETEVYEWDEGNEEALRIISFTVSDELQGPIRNGKTAKGAWDELQQFHAPNDKTRKFSLLRRLYRLDMIGSLSDHERTFDDIVQSLSAIGKDIDSDELIVLYASSLPDETFGHWIQTQMVFVDNITITEFKGRVREEARRLTLNGRGAGLGIENNDPDTVQANYARPNNYVRPNHQRIFPTRKVNNAFPQCSHCGFTNHAEKDCHKRIAEEYNAKQAQRYQPQNQFNQNQNQFNQRGRGKGRGRGGRGGYNPQGANLANANGSAPAYNSIFGGLAYCCKAAVNSRIRKVNGIWVKDCGATHHMHHDKSLFTDYHRLKHRLYVGGIGSGLLAAGIRNVRITDPNGNVRVLEGVLYVPKLKSGLMALNQLALLGWRSIIEKDGCTVSDGNFSIHSPIKNGLCVWSQSSAPQDGVNGLFAGVAPKKLSLTDWHERLGHVSKDTLTKFGDSAIEDLHLGLVEKSEDQHPCKPCIHGKQHRKPFPSRHRRRGKPLELVHSDLCESNVESIGGGKHVLTFTDDHTNHGMVYILKNKSSSTVLNAFKEYQAWAERQSGHKIKELRTDRGTEYMGDMIKFVKSQGIEHNPTSGYSPQSNGVAERMNRTLFEMACTMLDAAGASLELWAEAILAATHIRNRLPSRTLDGKSPHEAWTGEKPTVGHILTAILFKTRG